MVYVAFELVFSIRKIDSRAIIYRRPSQSKEVQLFARFGYGEQCQGAKSGPDARAGKGVRWHPSGTGLASRQEHVRDNHIHNSRVRRIRARIAQERRSHRRKMADYLFCDTKARDIRMIVGASTRNRVPVKRAINYSGTRTSISSTLRKFV